MSLACARLHGNTRLLRRGKFAAIQRGLVDERDDWLAFLEEMAYLDELMGPDICLDDFFYPDDDLDLFRDQASVYDDVDFYGMDEFEWRMFTEDNFL